MHNLLVEINGKNYLSSLKPSPNHRHYQNHSHSHHHGHRHHHWGTKGVIKEATREEIFRESQQSQYAQNPMAYPGFTDSFGWQRF